MSLPSPLNPQTGTPSSNIPPPIPPSNDVMTITLSSSPHFLKKEHTKLHPFPSNTAPKIQTSTLQSSPPSHSHSLTTSSTSQTTTMTHNRLHPVNMRENTFFHELHEVGKAVLPHIQYQWFILSHPLDPSLFHYLKHHHPSSYSQKGCIFMQSIISQLDPCCNRILLLDLVDELLSEILARSRLEQGLLVERIYVEEGWELPRCEVRVSRKYRWAERWRKWRGR
ncbi:hypothetical protein PIB30_014360 [Stylosanthes scabra]|uniref:DUF4378 domain-containing protein n=1 Tax=Stylosanthes scabra TaxID=79078 RepID=A0ABU6S711_9FABA|nr:hypothetical protein [Stylosanthes scabra]